MAESNTPSNGRSNGRSNTPSSTPGVAVAPASAAHGLGAPTQPELRWRSHVHDLAAIEQELSKIWAAVPLTMTVDGVEERRVAARTSVMNLVVIAATPEAGERCADAIGNLTGRHPSRTLIVLPSDPDGPSWVDAEIQAHCMLPREGLAEACSERIYLKAGGEVGRHLAALVAPLIIHDLPVTVWWPGDVAFRTEIVAALLALADRLVVDGSSWPGDGLRRLREMASLLDRPDLAVSDFALIRQSRWREAIASTFDVPDVQPFLRSLRRIGVAYAGPSDGWRGPVNVVKPIYHVAWLAARLGLLLAEPLRPVAENASEEQAAGRRDPGPGPGQGGTRFAGRLRQGRNRVDVSLWPEPAEYFPGRTLRVELEAGRRGQNLRVVVTADADTVMVDAWRNGKPFRHRPFPAPRRTDVDMLAEVIESIGQNRLTAETIRRAVALTAEPATGRAGRREPDVGTRPGAQPGGDRGAQAGADPGAQP